MDFDVLGARSEGYSDSEIADYLSGQSNFNIGGAREEGYQDAEIIDYLMAQQERPEEKGLFEEITDSAGDFIAGSATGFTTMVPLAAEGVGALAYSAGLTDELDNSLVRWGRESQRKLRETFGGDNSTHAYGVGNALGSFASFFVPYLGQAGLAARGAATAGKVVGLGGTGTLAVGAGAGDQAERILNLTEQLDGQYPAATENIKAAIGVGGLIGLTELAPVSMVAGIIAKGIPGKVAKEKRDEIIRNGVNFFFKSAPRRVGTVGVAEGSQELLAGYLQDLTEQGLYNPDLEIGQSAAADFGYGGTAGAIFQTGVELMMGRRNRSPAEAPNQEQAGAEANQDLQEQEVLGLPAPEPTLLLPDLSSSGSVVEPDADIPTLVQDTVDRLGADIPLSFNRGEIVAADDVGTPDSYTVQTSQDGIFVTSKQGVRVSPNMSSEAQAFEFSDILNQSVNDIIARQDQQETDRLAREAVQSAKAQETQATLQAASQTVRQPFIPAREVPSDLMGSMNARRVQTGKNPLDADSTLTVEELVDAGASTEVVNSLLPEVDGATVEQVRSAAAAKNILVEDAGFERFARRVAGGANIETMSPTQLGYMVDAISPMPILDGEGPQRLPVVQPTEYTGPQYSAVIAAVRATGSDGILKSQINKALDLKKGAPTESIIEAGERRGDLLPHPTRKNRWITKDVYNNEARDAALGRKTPFARGEEIEAGARPPETRDRILRAGLGQGIAVERTVTEEGPRLSPEQAATRFKDRLQASTVAPVDPTRLDALQQSVETELSRVKALRNQNIGVKIVDTIKTAEGKQAEGFIETTDDGQTVILLALDLAENGATTVDQVKNNLKDVMNHEIIHALEGLGVFSAKDRASLLKYAKNNGRVGEGETFYESVKGRYTEEALGRKPEESLLEEEAIADAFRFWAAGETKVTGKPLSLFNRIVDFFRGLSGAMRNSDFRRAEDVFSGIRSEVPVSPSVAEGSPDLTESDIRQGLQIPDAPRFALARSPLDLAAEKIIGQEAINDNGIMRRVRAADVPRAILQRALNRPLSQEEQADTRREKFALEGKYSLARKPIDKKDPVFSARNPENDYIDIGGKSVPNRGKARRLSVIDLLYNPDFASRKGNTTGYVAKLLQERAKRVIKSPIKIETDTSKDGLISDALALEAIAALRTSGNASDWYSKSVQEALRIASRLHPEIATDPDAKFLFLSALSVTSQNTAVMDNARYADEVYNIYKQTGRFPEDYGKGKFAQSMKDNFAVLNGLIESRGTDGTREFFDQQFTVKQLEEAGFSPPSGENKNTLVYGSYLLGPKIGQGFYQNLNGNFTPVTIDMWFMRTIGRMTGRLIGKPDIVEKQTDRLIEGLRADPEKRQNNFLISQLFDAKIDGDIDTILEIADELRKQHDRIFSTPEVQAQFQAKTYEKPEWAKAAEGLVSQQMKPQDSPASGNFRSADRRITDKVREKVEASGYNVTNADLQAILWYPEKDLYKALGTRTRENINIDYAQAFDIIQKEQQSSPAANLLGFIKSNPDGFTVSIDGETVPPSGFAVAPIKVAEIEVRPDQLTEDVVDQLIDNIERIQAITNEDIYAGGWLDSESGNYFLDASMVIDDPARALYAANASEQLAIFDLGTFNEIRTTEGIEQLKSDGVYSPQADADARRKAEALDRSFRAQRIEREGIQGQVEPSDLQALGRGRERLEIEGKFSLQRKIDDQRQSFNTYNERHGVPLSAYLADPLGEDHQIIFDGRGSAVYIARTGFDKLSKTRQKTFGFGPVHYKKHNAKIAQNTNGLYKNLEELTAAALDNYWPFRNNPEAAGFKIIEQQSAFGAPMIRMEWRSDDFGYPAVFIFQPIYIDVLSPSQVRQDPKLSGKTVSYLWTGYVGSSDGKSDTPVPQPAVSVKPERSEEEQKAVERGMSNAVNPEQRKETQRKILTLKKKYSIGRSRDNMTPEAREALDRNINFTGRETFFEKIMGMFDRTDPAKRSVSTRIRAQVIDRYAGMRATNDKLQKEGVEIAIESNINGAIAQLERKKGVVSAGITIGPLIRSRGLIGAISQKLVEKTPQENVRKEYQEAFERLKAETSYVDVDPLTGQRVTVEYLSPADLKGLATIFEEIDNNNLYAQYALYAAARRAFRLSAEGREKTFSDADIQTGLKIGEENPAVVRAYRDFQLWNNAFINVMRDTGVISSEAADLWRRNADYLPFYRQLYDNEGTIFEVGDSQETKSGNIVFKPDNSANNRVFDSLYNVKAPKELKGGKPVFFVMVNDTADTLMFSTYEDAERRQKALREINPNQVVRIQKSNQKIDNPIDNLLRNFDAGVTAAMTNVVASRAVRDLQRLNLARRTDAPGDAVSPDIVGIKIDGKTVHYTVQDEMLLDAMKASGEFQLPGLDLISMPARLLRELVTKDPGFMAANMLRDSLSSWISSGVTTIPGPGTLSGFVKAATRSPVAEALEATGVVGGYDAKQDADAMKVFKRINDQKGRASLNPITWWNHWDKVSLASDTATRAAVYEKVLETTENQTAALIEALEVINFSRKGANPIVRFLTATIPFLNARIQGLDVIYRSATKGNIGTETTMSRAQRQRRFYFRALTLAAASAAYALTNMSEDEEENPWFYNASEVDRDMYWIIPPTWFGLDTDTDTPALRIPIPFELGILFKVIPERIIRTVHNQTDQPENVAAFWRHLSGTLAVQAPQIIMPAAEAMFNYDTFKGRPIVTYWQERNYGFLANPAFNSPLSINISTFMNDKFNVQWNPEKIDHLMRGYTGTLGGYALMASDSIMREASGMPERASRRLDQYPVLGRLLQEQEGSGPVQAFYDIYNEIDIFVKSVNNLQKQGRLEDIDKLYAQRGKVALSKDVVLQIKQEISDIRNLIKEVDADPVISGDDKRERIAGYRAMMNDLVRNIIREKGDIIGRTD